MNSYKTVVAPAEAVTVEKKSRFIAYALPVSSEGDVQAELARLRKEHWGASHHVYAYALRGEAGGPPRTRSSDDGEPSGSAGAPVLEALAGAGLVDTLAVVVRYFGGTLLGVGGLVRAYSGAAKAALENAGTVEKRLCREYSLSLDYALWNRVGHMASGFRQSGIEYGERVTARFLVESGRAEEFEAFVADATAGAAAAEVLGEGFYGL